MRGYFYTTTFKLLFAFLALVSVSACEYHVNKKSLDTSAQSFDAQATINADFIKDSVLSSCKSCHSGSTQPNLNSADAVIANIAKVQNEVNSNQMPPPSSGYVPLSQCAKDLLQEWVANGMPKVSNKKVITVTSCANGSASTPEKKNILEMPVNYQTLTTEILQPKCLKCHNPKGPDIMAADYLLYPYSEITNHGRLLDIKDGVLKNKLYRIISEDDEDRMPPPEESGMLTADQIEFVRRWLEAGSPEN